MNIENWKEFRVGDLFEVITKTALNSFTKRSEKTDDYVVPALSSTVDNHSFGYYVKAKDHDVINRLCLSITSNGDAGKVYLQNQPFAIAQDAYAIYLKDNDEKNVYLFIATVLEKLLIQKYNYNNKAGWNKVKKETILLPAIDKNTPDFDYMEKYIEEIKIKYINELSRDNNLKINKALEITGLSYKDLDQELVVKPARRYEEFRVGDLFDSVKISGINNDSLNKNFNDGVYRYITRTSLNFGISDTTGKISGVKLQNANTFSLGLLNMDFFFQSEPWYAGQFVRAIVPKFEINNNLAIYFQTIFNKRKEIYKKVLVRDFDETFLNDVIKLPAIDKETPDFDYMEKAIYIYIEKKIRFEKLFNEKKIELLRSII